MLDPVLEFLLSPTFRVVVLFLSVATSVPSALLTWFAWAKVGKDTILAIACLFSAWALSSSFFAVRYALGETQFSQLWFIIPNIASLVMSASAVMYLRSILSIGPRHD